MMCRISHSVSHLFIPHHFQLASDPTFPAGSQPDSLRHKWTILHNNVNNYDMIKAFRLGLATFIPG